MIWLLLACSTETETERPPNYPWITDEQGRVLILHGANVDGSAKSTEDHMPRQDRETIERMATDWGWNHARFLIFWDGLEPEQGVHDEAYLDLIETRLDWLGEAGIHVVLDMHQDVYSSVFCCDGAPEWAVRDDGESFELQSQWFLNYFQPAVQRSFDNFWLYTDGDHADLQDHYMASWVLVAERFGDHPAVLGYDLMNEPHPGSLVDGQELLGNENPSGTHYEFDQERLQPFYQRTIEAIREVDEDSWIFFEPRYGAPGDGLPSYMGVLTDPREAGDRLVYHPHLYSVILEATGEYKDDDTTVANWEENRALEAAAQDCAVVLGEWGLSQSTEGAERFMGDVVDMADRSMAGWSYWDYGFGGWLPVDGDGNELETMDVLVRVYPQRVAGTPVSFGFDRDSRVFELEFTDREGVSGATEIYVPPRHYPDGFDVELSDGDWVFDTDSNLLSVTVEPVDGVHRVGLRPL
ncbi:MAG: glycoside hydrolase family 5 protein [Proteobacteria bacterium]|nr:glycoside hydrolase family 5 protein [Pseudomonadota bacterium]MCP4916163.1 glycoside hydrolase family 5 protein [Pseudomonadota bacterium]